jgi:hypothetical protein
MIFLKRKFQGIRQLCLLLFVLTLLLSANPVSALSGSAEPQKPDLSTAESSMPAVRAVSKVRVIPALGSVIIGCLEDGTVLSVLGEDGAYYRIDCFDMTGFILKQQVAVGEDGTYRVRCSAQCSETTYFANNNTAQALNLTGQLKNTAIAYLGKPYVKGGTGPRGFDCSGLTQHVFETAGYSLKRTVAQQLQSGIIIPKEDLQCGDLVFFKYTTATRSLYSHIGIYIGNGQVLHASTSRGVTIDDLDSPYYTEHYLCARRVVLSDISEINTIPSVSATQNFNSSYWRENSRTEPSGNSYIHSRKITKCPLYKLKKTCYNS